MNDKAQYWLEIADYDMETAKAMFETKRYLYVGFMCQQVMEKSMKAVITNSGEGVMPPKIHNLIKLANLSNLTDKMTDSQQKLIEFLNPLSIEARYPEQKISLNLTLNKERCASFLVETEDLLCWIKQQL